MRIFIFLLMIVLSTSDIFLKRHPYLVLFGYRNINNIKKYIQQSNILDFTNFTDCDMRRALLLF